MGMVTIETKNPSSSIRLLRLLLLEQDHSNAAKILRELKDSGLEIAPCIAGDAQECKKALNSGKYDAIISAWKLADGDGQELLRELRENRGDTPLVLVTGEPEEKAAEDSARCGAVDYVSKDRLARLPFALKRAVGEHRLAVEVARLRASRQENETPESELTRVDPATADPARVPGACGG
jgi:DNA-binding NtrC family response regulator